MTYEVVFVAAAKRDLGQLPEKIAAAVIEFAAGPLSENPYRVGKPLIGDQLGLFSTRREGYRVIYRIVDDRVEVQIIRIRYRTDVHRRD